MLSNDDSKSSTSTQASSTVVGSKYPISTASKSKEAAKLMAYLIPNKNLSPSASASASNGSHSGIVVHEKFPDSNMSQEKLDKPVKDRSSPPRNSNDNDNDDESNNDNSNSNIDNNNNNINTIYGGNEASELVVNGRDREESSLDSIGRRSTAEAGTGRAMRASPSMDATPATGEDTRGDRRRRPDSPVSSVRDAQFLASFNGVSRCAVFPVPASSFQTPAWVGLLRPTHDLAVNPFARLPLPLSEYFDLTLPPVDAVCLTPWPRPLHYYRPIPDHPSASHLLPRQP
jgi:hypothetical protein